MRGIDYFGTLIMWLAVFIGWLIKGCKTNLFKECAKKKILQKKCGNNFCNISYRAGFLGECRGG